MAPQIRFNANKATCSFVAKERVGNKIEPCRYERNASTLQQISLLLERSGVFQTENKIGQDILMHFWDEKCHPFLHKVYSIRPTPAFAFSAVLPEFSSANTVRFPHCSRFCHHLVWYRKFGTSFLLLSHSKIHYPWIGWNSLKEFRACSHHFYTAQVLNQTLVR